MYFRLKALDEDGRVVRRTIEAGDAVAARQQIAAEGLHALRLTPENPLAGWLQARRTRFATDLFVEELDTLLDAGLSLVDAVDTLGEKAGASEPVLATLRGALDHGLNFSQALARQPDCFPPLLVLSVRAAEASGRVGDTLRRYLAYRARVEAVRRKIATASIYPAVLAVVGALVAAFMLFHVVPRFAAIYDGLAGELPGVTRLLVAWGDVVGAHGGKLLAGAFLGIAAVVVFVRHQHRSGRLRAALIRLPLIGEQTRRHEETRVFRTLAMLLDSGVPLARAIDLAAETASPATRAAFAGVTARVVAGLPFHRALAETGVGTVVALRLLRVGEDSGQLAAMAERVAAFHEAELDRWLDRLMATLEPALMLFIGGGVGLVLLLLYLPIFELAANLR